MARQDDFSAELLPRDEDIERLCSVLSAGGIAAFPTDTVWALGCLAHDEAAAARLRALRGLPPGEGMVALVDGLEQLRRYVPYVSEKAANLIEYYTRPLTIVYENVQGIAPSVLHGDGTAAFRVVQRGMPLRLLRRLDCALVATQAPARGGRALEGVDAEMFDQIQAPTLSLPSTLIRIAPNGDLIFLRKGYLQQ